jgi:hypothetical protein
MISELTNFYIKAWLELLEQFVQNGHHSININKVANGLHLSPDAIDQLLELTLQYQELFCSILPDNSLIKIRKNDTWYLTISPRSENRTEIQISREELDLLNDVMYYFQHIVKGKGFDTRFTTSELLEKVKRLNKAHPYFFERRGNGFVYPSTLALSLGSKLEKLNRTKKMVNCISINNLLIQIK